MNHGEIKKMRKEKKFFDFTHFPRHFKTPQETIDYYNDMCYDADVQWQFGRVNNGSKEAFVIECPFSKMCPVRVKFTWNRMKCIFSRDASFAIFHDHCTQKVDMEALMTPEIVDEARTLIHQSGRKIKASELADQLKIKPYLATHIIKTTPMLDFSQGLPDSLSTQDMFSTMSNMGP